MSVDLQDRVKRLHGNVACRAPTVKQKLGQHELAAFATPLHASVMKEAVSTAAAGCDQPDCDHSCCEQHAALKAALQTAASIEAAAKEALQQKKQKKRVEEIKMRFGQTWAASPTPWYGR